MGWWSNWLEKEKKTWVFSAAKQVGRGGAKVIQYGAPAVGTLFFGLPGAAVGTGLGALAAQVGPTKNPANQAKNSLLYGASIFGGSSLLNLAGGVPLGSTIFKSIGGIFGPSAADAAAAGADKALPRFPGEGLNASQAPAGGGGGFPQTALDLARAAATVTAGGGNNAQLLDQYRQQLALADQLRAQGDMPGALRADAQAEAYRQLLAQSGQSTAGGGFPWGLLLLGAGAVWLLTRGKSHG